MCDIIFPKLHPHQQVSRFLCMLAVGEKLSFC